MKKRLSRSTLLKVSSVIHPLLFAVLPVLSLYNHNISETSAGQIVRPLLLCALGALFLWLALSLLLKSMLKGGFAATVFVFFFFSYGHFYDLLVKWDLFEPRHAYLFPAALLVFGYCVYFIHSSRRDFRNTTRILNVVVVVLVCLNLVTIAIHEARDTRQTSAFDPGAEVPTAGMDPGELAAMPDIYYIIVDEYSASSTMTEYYDYDNAQFVNALAGKGFFVASASTVAYSFTDFSLATSLNMEYMPPEASHEFCMGKMANNAVVQHLKSVGYKYVYSGVYFEKDEIGADLYYNFYETSGGDTVVSEFSRTLWNTTMARPFYDHLTRAVYAGHYRPTIVDQIECLKTMPEVEGPKFVFAHIVCPHAPFVFGPNGEYIDPLDFYNFEDKQFYLGQYRFMSNQIEGVVAALLDNSKVEPIIVIQSDHGLRVHGVDDYPEDEWQKVFNAYYLPGGGEQALYDSISPVNSFRVIFNEYFGTHYDLLPDTNPAQSAD